MTVIDDSDDSEAVSVVHALTNPVGVGEGASSRALQKSMEISTGAGADL